MKPRSIATCLSLLLVLTLLASCGTFQVDVEQTPTLNVAIESTMQALQTENAKLRSQLATLEVTEQPPNFPTPVTTSVPTIIVQPDGVNRIKFSPLGTWASLTGHLEKDQPQKYVLSALKGQVMGVSASGVFGIQITGQDGTDLAADARGPYWRGILPQSQDYLITVGGPGQEGDFDLHITINPLGQAKQYLQFYSEQDQLAIDYPDSFAPVNFNYDYSSYLKGKIALSLSLIEPHYYQDTNLSEVYFLLAVSHNPQVASICEQPSFPDEKERRQEMVNGIPLIRSTASTVATGNSYDYTIYRAAQKGYCYEIVFLIHSNDLSLFPAGSRVKFDRDGVVSELNEILQSMTIIPKP